MGVANISRKLTARRLFFIGFWFCFAILNLAPLTVLTQAYRSAPLLVAGFMTSTYLAGPVNLIFYQSLLNPGLEFKSRARLHLIAPAIVFAGELFFFICIDSATQVAEIHKIARATGFSLLHLPVYLGSISILIYFGFIIWYTKSLPSVPSGKTAQRFIVFLLSFFCATTVVFLLASLTGRDSLFWAAGYLLAAGNLVLFFAHLKYPDFFQLMEKSLREARYKQSMLNGVDVSAVVARMEYLMREEKIYSEPLLSLKSMAKILGVSGHQLSEILNHKLETNFAQYINQYRVSEAERLVVAEPEKSLLAIAFEVGFNSKNSFNRNFRKLTGKNPSELRG